MCYPITTTSQMVQTQTNFFNFEVKPMVFSGGDVVFFLLILVVATALAGILQAYILDQYDDVVGWFTGVGVSIRRLANDVQECSRTLKDFKDLQKTANKNASNEKKAQKRASKATKTDAFVDVVFSVVPPNKPLAGATNQVPPSANMAFGATNRVPPSVNMAFGGTNQVPPCSPQSGGATFGYSPAKQAPKTNIDPFMCSPLFWEDLLMSSLAGQVNKPQPASSSTNAPKPATFPASKPTTNPFAFPVQVDPLLSAFQAGNKANTCSQAQLDDYLCADCANLQCNDWCECDYCYSGYESPREIKVSVQDVKKPKSKKNKSFKKARKQFRSNAQPTMTQPSQNTTQSTRSPTQPVQNTTQPATSTTQTTTQSVKSTPCDTTSTSPSHTQTNQAGFYDNFNCNKNNCNELVGFMTDFEKVLRELQNSEKILNDSTTDEAGPTDETTLNSPIEDYKQC